MKPGWNERPAPGSLEISVDHFVQTKSRLQPGAPVTWDDRTFLDERPPEQVAEDVETGRQKLERLRAQERATARLLDKADDSFQGRKAPEASIRPGETRGPSFTL